MLDLMLAAGLWVQSPTTWPIELASSPASLHGTWQQPTTAAAAAAVIIPGSGPTDRDGNNPISGRSDNLRMLAEGLAAEGVATVRIDKRGIGRSLAAGLQEQDLRFDHYVEDAVAWAARAAQESGLPCAWLIGHSEGALVALAASARQDRRICGLVLLSGAGRPAADAIADQLRSGLPEPLLTQGLATLDALRVGETVETTTPELAALFRPSVQPYLISWFGHDPQALISAYRGRVLIALGTHDVQIPVTDAEHLAQAQPEARLILWDGVSHVLKPAPADRIGNLATYGQADLDLDPRVVPDVAGFILGRD